MKNTFDLDLVEPGTRPAHDFVIADHGSIITFTPLTAEAQLWWDQHVQPGPSIANAFAVEARYVIPLVEGIEADGFTIA